VEAWPVQAATEMPLRERDSPSDRSQFRPKATGGPLSCDFWLHIESRAAGSVSAQPGLSNLTAKLGPGMAVADVGAGFGAWTMRLARWIGPAGRVYATEIGAAQLTALRDTVQRERLTNVTVLDAANTTNRPDSEVRTIPMWSPNSQ
jgi:tRNA G46 methylase TrmB